MLHMLRKGQSKFLQLRNCSKNKEMIQMKDSKRLRSSNHQSDIMVTL